MIRDIDGKPTEFVKSSTSHLEGLECLYVGASGDAAELFESDNPEVSVRTSRGKLARFIEGAKSGEFDHLVT